MKKNTSKNLTKRLAQYGTMSAAVMAGADANGQVVYTDVDPDVTLQVGEVFSLDFEGDTFEDVEVNNPEDLAQAMQTLAQNKTLRQRLGYNARKRVSTMYSSSFMDELIIEEYLELLGKLR